MKKSRYTDSQILSILKQNESGTSVPDLCREHGTPGSARAYPELLLVPLYHKIRIPFGSIHDQIMQLDPLITLNFNALNTIFTQPNIHEWDIYLTTVNDIKSELINNTNLDENIRHQVLTSGMPKYIWRSTLLYNDIKILDIFFDATDIEQSSFVINVIGYNVDFSNNLKLLLNHSQIKKTFGNSIAWPIIEWVRINF